MAPCFILKWILMVLFTAGPTVSGSPVRGVVGQNVTLPCKYHVNSHNDVTTMCWGRGPCPNSQCSEPILWTDGWRVTERPSSRYRLEGNLAQGDVSLTIVHAAEADGGVYCCRVEIRGWFNDQRNNLEVVMEEAGISTTGPHASMSEHTSVAANATTVSSSVTPQWLSVSRSEAPRVLNVSSSVHPLEPESTGTGMYVRISIILSLLVILISALLIFTHKRSRNVPESNN